MPMPLNSPIVTLARASRAISDEPPTSFLLFAWGVNESDKGPAVLDKEGAAEIVKRLGSREVMIDLEHKSIDFDSPHWDPDARGWFKLAVTDDGLMAVDVRWTADGERRLREKLQRYTSPAFRCAKGTDRVVELVNVALTALPATTYIEPLIAASRRHNIGESMDPELIAKMLDALEKGDAKAALGLLKESIAAAAGATPPASDPATDPAATSVEPETKEDEEPAAALNADDEKDEKEMLSKLSREVATSVKRQKELQEQLRSIQKANEDTERESLIAANRGKLGGKLTEWARRQPIAALKDYLKDAPTVATEEIHEPAHETITLSKADQDMCRKYGTNPETVKAVRARRMKEVN